MFCPMLYCEWQVGELVSSIPNKEVAPEDNLVTQFSILVDHLKNDHNAVVGGKE